MITAAQLRASRALLGIDQQTLAKLAGVSLPTIQRMEASQGNVRGVIDTLTKVVAALDRAGIEMISDHARSEGRGRGVRLREPPLDRVSQPPEPARGQRQEKPVEGQESRRATMKHRAGRRNREE